MQSEHDDERFLTCTSACSNQQTKDIMSANEARSKKSSQRTTVPGKERKEAEHAQNDDEEDEGGVTGNDDADREKQSMSTVITLDRI